MVVGGGIAGASAALFLAQRGIPTVLCEKGKIAAEQSSRNWGWVRKMGRDPREMPLMIEAMRIWERAEQFVGADLGFRRSGIVYLCEDEEELSRREAWLGAVAPYQIDSRLISGSELERILPGSARSWAGGLYTESDGRAEPQKTAVAFVRAAESAGAKLFTDCAVRGVETAAGRVCAVVTEKGRIKCRAVVLAGGAWSSMFCRNLGIRLPQLKVLASVMRLAAFEGGPDSAALGPGFAFRKRLDGGYTIANGHLNVADIVPDSFRFFRDFTPVLQIEWRSLKLRLGKRFLEEIRFSRHWDLDEVTPFERVRVLDPAPYIPALASAKRNLERAFPVFQGKAVSDCWAGLIDATPDAVPVISGVDTLPGLFISTGFSGHGFGIGPAAGFLIADLVTGREPIVDPSPFRYSRFTNGERPLPTTGL